MPKSIKIIGDIDYLDEIFQYFSNINKSKSSITFRHVSLKNIQSESLSLHLKAISLCTEQVTIYLPN